ncbi:MAG: zinc ribbon domain-containing protein [Blautia sp.]|nr:zinc ribbon domain-containing protein [Blautia sp.]
MPKKSLFDSLIRTGESFSHAVKDVSERAGNLYETQKLRGQIASEGHHIERLKTEIGTLLYCRYENGEIFEGEMGRLCEEISQHLARIESLEKESAKIRGKKICPACRKEVPIEALFCPSCGTPCPEPEPAEEEEDPLSFLDEAASEEETVPAQEAEALAAEDEKTVPAEEADPASIPVSQEKVREFQDMAASAMDILQNATNLDDALGSESPEPAEDISVFDNQTNAEEF